jgi:hypothetical protein
MISASSDVPLAWKEESKAIYNVPASRRDENSLDRNFPVRRRDENSPVCHVPAGRRDESKPVCSFPVIFWWDFSLFSLLQQVLSQEAAMFHFSSPASKN